MKKLEDVFYVLGRPVNYPAYGLALIFMFLTHLGILHFNWFWILSPIIFWFGFWAVILGIIRIIIFIDDNKPY